MHRASVGHEVAWTVPAPVPEMTYLTAGPGETTLAPEEDRGARMMKTAAGEAVVEGGEEEEEAGWKNLPVTLNMNLARNQGLGGMNATL